MIMMHLMAIVLLLVDGKMRVINLMRHVLVDIVTILMHNMQPLLVEITTTPLVQTLHILLWLEVTATE